MNQPNARFLSCCSIQCSCCSAEPLVDVTQLRVIEVVRSPQATSMSYFWCQFELISIVF